MISQEEATTYWRKVGRETATPFVRRTTPPARAHCLLTTSVRCVVWSRSQRVTRNLKQTNDQAPT